MTLLTQAVGSDAQKLLMIVAMLGVLVVAIGLMALWRRWYVR